MILTAGWACHAAAFRYGLGLCAPWAHRGSHGRAWDDLLMIRQWQTHHKWGIYIAICVFFGPTNLKQIQVKWSIKVSRVVGCLQVQETSQSSMVKSLLLLLLHPTAEKNPYESPWISKIFRDLFPFSMHFPRLMSSTPWAWAVPCTGSRRSGGRCRWLSRKPWLLHNLSYC